LASFLSSHHNSLNGRGKSNLFFFGDVFVHFA
jgi:hypothetical protein